MQGSHQGECFPASNRDGKFAVTKQSKTVQFFFEEKKTSLLNILVMWLSSANGNQSCWCTVLILFFHNKNWKKKRQPHRGQVWEYHRMTVADSRYQLLEKEPGLQDKRIRDFPKQRNAWHFLMEPGRTGTCESRSTLSKQTSWQKRGHWPHLHWSGQHCKCAQRAPLQQRTP